MTRQRQVVLVVTSDGETQDLGHLWPVGIGDGGGRGRDGLDDDQSTVAVRWTSDGGLESLNDVTTGDAPPLEDVRAVSAGGIIVVTIGSIDEPYALLPAMVGS